MNLRQVQYAPILVLFAILLSTATASAQRIRNSVPAQQVPAWQLEQQPTVQTFPEVEYLRAPKPKTYLLDSGDVLGVFLEGLLGRPGDAPPVHFPPESSSLGPSIGFPFVVQENGTVSLPAVDPIPVRGLTIEQAEGLIKSVYTVAGRAGSSILTGQSKVIVTCLLYTSPSPRDQRGSRMPSSA